MVMPQMKSKAKSTTAAITELDEKEFRLLIRQSLTPEEQERITHPQDRYPKDKSVLAVHWHPEWVEMPLVHQRVNHMFPNMEEHLIIPTQHNELMVYDDFAGVEVDCYSPEFNCKVQLLLHFHPDRVKDAQVLKSMISHTFNYRSGQLFNFLHKLAKESGDFGLQKAASQSGAGKEVLDFVRGLAQKLLLLLDQWEAEIPPTAIKNKLIRDFLDLQRSRVDKSLVDRAQFFVSNVKKQIKQEFDLSYFYHTQDFIAETRALGGGIVIPHPEQFWPVLIAGYDVDGIEVWNPQSFTYTEFLINWVQAENKKRKKRERQLLTFMGDDCHLGEKLKPPTELNAEKAGREIGLQPPWADLKMQKSLIQACGQKEQIIKEYRQRLEA